jgi:hypothetical protein
MQTYRGLWLKKQRRLRGGRFALWHAAAVAAWADDGEVWPEIALSGPWEGIAEDLTKEAITLQSLADARAKSTNSRCGDMSRREAGECTRVACVARAACAYVGAGDQT